MTDEPIVALQALRSAPPLRDSDYAAIRARVRAGIARKRSLLWWRLAAVAALLLLVLGVGTLVEPRRESPVAHKPSVPHRSLTPPQVVMATPEPVPTRKAPATKRRKPRPAAVAVAVAVAQETGTPMRIQMATADPDVRIIWIVNNTEER